MSRSQRVTTDKILEALSGYMALMKVFKTERCRDYAPPEHTVFYNMFRSKKLTQRQCIAANCIYEDALKAFGSSKGLVMGYSDKIDVSVVTQELLAYENASQARLRELVCHLHKHEWLLLVMVVKELNRNDKTSIDLAALGSVKSGYKSGQLAYAAGVATLQAFLDSAAEFYRVR